jgi:hypothetical protein
MNFKGEHIMKTCTIDIHHLNNPMTAAEALEWAKEIMMPSAFQNANGCFYNYSKTFGGKLANAYNYAVLRKDPETGKTIRRGTQKDAIRESFANIVVDYYVITEDHDGKMFLDFHTEETVNEMVNDINRITSHGCKSIIVNRYEN